MYVLENSIVVRKEQETKWKWGSTDWICAGVVQNVESGYALGRPELEAFALFFTKPISLFYHAGGEYGAHWTPTETCWLAFSCPSQVSLVFA